MTALALRRTRGPLVESSHAVHLAVVDPVGRVTGRWGTVDLPVFWRSAAKPFQALAAVEDGVPERFDWGPDVLALACASHSSEPRHRSLAGAMLATLGLDERALACGPHPPLGSEMEARVRLGLDRPTPVWSNCSGKHALMLALARRHDWPVEGYARDGHPVQQRILATIAERTGVPVGQMPIGVDGCNTICTAVPLVAMARAWARLGAGHDAADARVRDAMRQHPELVAGEGRLCTALMAAAPGRLVVKVGAEGVYCAALLREGVGLALKVQDGSMPHAGVALLAVLRLLDDAHGLGLREALEAGPVRRHGPGTIRNTRGEPTGDQRLEAEPREFADALRAADAVAAGHEE